MYLQADFMSENANMANTNNKTNRLLPQRQETAFTVCRLSVSEHLKGGGHNMLWYKNIQQYRGDECNYLITISLSSKTA